jgi:hypothetical protein
MPQVTDRGVDATGRRARGGVRGLVTRGEVLVALLVLVAVGPLVHPNGAQQASRYVLTAAIWDEGTFRLDSYADLDPPVLGIDRSVRQGHTYSDKAPLQPMLAVPFYASFRAVGGEPATEARYSQNLGIWWLTFWTATVPSAILAALMYRMGRRVSLRTGLASSLALFFGSMLLPFAALLFGHALAAALVFAAFSLLVGALTPGRLAGAGALIGAAVATEYTAGIAAIILTSLVIWRNRVALGWFLAGAVPFALLLGWYHAVAFGSPIAHPYRYSAFNEVTAEARGFFAIFSSFNPENGLAVFVSWRGFLLASPIVLLGLVGLVTFLRSRTRGDAFIAVTAIAMFVGFLLIPLFWTNPWGGDSPGPRYMTPAIPFLVVGVAHAWERFRLAAMYATALSVSTMVLATVTVPLLGPGWQNGVGRWIVFASEGIIAPTIYSMALGPIGWVLHIATIAVVLRALARADRLGVTEGQASATLSL